MTPEQQKRFDTQIEELDPIIADILDGFDLEKMQPTKDAQALINYLSLEFDLPLDLARSVGGLGALAGYTTIECMSGRKVQKLHTIMSLTYVSATLAGKLVGLPEPRVKAAFKYAVKDGIKDALTTVMERL